MATEYFRLRDFSDADLIFDDEETKGILAFFFPTERAAIDAATVSRPLRNFAQGLLVAAVDASYAMGWVELTFSWVTNPGSTLKKALGKLGKKALRYWFKHATDKDLRDVKVYESVRRTLSYQFTTHLKLLLQENLSALRKRSNVATVHDHFDRKTERAWG
jgi:hypothetical protein